MFIVRRHGACCDIFNKKKGSSEHPEENGTGQVVAQVEEVVTMETGDYHDYGDMMETSEDVEARIKQIVKGT